MTGREICEMYIKYKFPYLPADEIRKMAKEFWESSPTGELDHVRAAVHELFLAGLLSKGTIVSDFDIAACTVHLP